MKLIKPKFWETKNFISLILYPFSAITFLINSIKKFSIKKTFEIKTICIGNIFIGGTGKTSLAIEINELLRKKFRTVFIKKNYENQMDEINLLKNRGKIISSSKRENALSAASKKKSHSIPQRRMGQITRRRHGPHHGRNGPSAARVPTRVDSRVPATRFRAASRQNVHLPHI